MPNPLGRAADAVAPPRLGRSFRLLLLTSVVTNTGDGIALAAGPLLVASQTRDPLIVSMAVLAQNLPVLLFGFAAGVMADRVDRVRLMAVVNVVRGIVLALLAASVATHVVSIWVVLAALFALGTAETFADIGSASILPRLVAQGAAAGDLRAVGAGSSEPLRPERTAQDREFNRRVSFKVIATAAPQTESVPP